MSHYYTSDPDLPHQTAIIEYNLGKQKLRFLTDAGVFSRQKVDYGSNVLIHSLPPLEGKVLDLGCGYGPIGISAAALNPDCQVTMVDINKRAVALAKDNIKTNGVINAKALESDGFTNIDGKFSTIFSNPPIRTGKKIMYSLFEESKGFLEPGGSLWLVIQKKQGAASAAAKLELIFGNCSIVHKAGGYWILKGSLVPQRIIPPLV